MMIMTKGSSSTLAAAQFLTPVFPQTPAPERYEVQLKEALSCLLLFSTSKQM